MGSGMARGAKARGKRIAFGDGQRIIFGPWSEIIFRFNPNVARPGNERSSDLEWIAHHKGRRLYNSLNHDRTRWVWNMEFRPVPGEMFFSDDEKRWADRLGKDFVLIESNVSANKSVAPNKQWQPGRYDEVANRLKLAGRDVRQFSYHGAMHQIPGVATIKAPDFRYALAALSRAALYIGPEGGLHHGAAAVGIPAVVLFGGFIPAQVTGYDTHTNLTGGATQFCGSLYPCQHCQDAMRAISVDDVIIASQKYLTERKAA